MRNKELKSEMGTQILLSGDLGYIELDKLNRQKKTLESLNPRILESLLLILECPRSRLSAASSLHLPEYRRGVELVRSGLF